MRLIDVTETFGLAEVLGMVDTVRLVASLEYVRGASSPVLVEDTLDTDVYVFSWELSWTEGEASAPF
jgi:hypothetical protein